mgnify:CR=1 FL=1
MKTMVYIFFSFFMFCAMNLNAQSPIEIDTVSLRYVNGFTNQHEIVDEYQMTNHSNEEYITWVSLEPTNDKSNIELVHDFFKKIKGDFSYIQAMYEELLDNRPSITGYSFIKKIAPGETSVSYTHLTLPTRHLPISLSKQIRNQIFIPKGLSL